MNCKSNHYSNSHLKQTRSVFTRRTAIAVLGCALMSQAHPTDTLYDPEPPADSGYVRVMWLADTANFSVVVNGKTRVSSLGKQQVSEYMVMPAGKHQINLTSSGQVRASVVLDVARATASTVVFTSSGTAPHVITDKVSTNKLKSMLSVYQFISKKDALDILTGDGATKVFSGLAYGSSGALQVNPISVELIAAKSGSHSPLIRTSLTMSQGGAYSVFLISTSNTTAAAVVVQNKIERYTGK